MPNPRDYDFKALLRASTAQPAAAPTKGKRDPWAAFKKPLAKPAVPTTTTITTTVTAQVATTAGPGPARTAAEKPKARVLPYTMRAEPPAVPKSRSSSYSRSSAPPYRSQASTSRVVDLTGEVPTYGGSDSARSFQSTPPDYGGYGGFSQSSITSPPAAQPPPTPDQKPPPPRVLREAKKAPNEQYLLGLFGKSEAGWGKAREKYVKPTHKEHLSLPGQPYVPGSLQRPVSTIVPEEVMLLSAEQEAVARFVVDKRENLFFTGSAGTGKSVLLRELIRRLYAKYNEPGVIATTASTGIAACNIGGTTLHAFAGCGLAKGPVEHLAKIAMRNITTRERWQTTKVLIIDEISMVEGDFFDKLNLLGQTVRHNTKPFGGIQVIACGDFMQLPPVMKQSRFAFEAETWSVTMKRTIQLTHVFRQKDPRFITLLNEMRVGIVSPESERILTGLSRDLDFGDGLEPTQLYAVRTQVDAANSQRLNSLSSTVKKFQSTDVGKSDNDRNKLKDCMAPPFLELKVGAQVMLIRNLDPTLVNGSLGIVMAFSDETGFPIVEFHTAGSSRLMEVVRETWTVELPGIGVIASRTQIPLILAYSMSIHKSQGQTLERVKVDLGRVFENGQAYVALSRATCLEGLQVLNYTRAKVMVDPRVVAFNTRLQSVGFR